MTQLKATEFIDQVLVKEVGRMIEDHPYLSFLIISVGIEFLGKCIDSTLQSWGTPGRSKKDFEYAIKTIPSLQKYKGYLESHDLYGSFRCGLAHAVVPGSKVTLSSKGERGHLIEVEGKINLKIEDFYRDFKAACEHVNGLQFTEGDKMKSTFLNVPGGSFNAGTEIAGGITSSLAP